MGSVRVAIVGLGNCASALVQGVEYYKNARDGEFVPGLMHTRLGPYHVGDIEFSAAFDIDERKVRSEEHTSELQSQSNLVCRLLLEKKKTNYIKAPNTTRNITAIRHVP